MTTLRRFAPHWSTLLLTASLVFCAAILLAGNPSDRVTTAGRTKKALQPTATGAIQPARLSQSATSAVQRR